MKLSGQSAALAVVGVPIVAFCLAGCAQSDAGASLTSEAEDAVPASGASPNSVTATQRLEQRFQATAQAYCVSCHGAKKPKGGLRLDTLKFDPKKRQSLAVWRQVLSRLSDGDMPPKGAKALPVAKRDALVKSLKSVIGAVDAAGLERRPVVLRRMNRIQYRNTLRDLLKIDVTDDPTKNFPADESDDGFTTVGESLKMSRFLLTRHMEAADVALGRATCFGPRPETQLVRIPKNRIPGDLNNSDKGYTDIVTSSAVFSVREKRLFPRGRPGQPGYYVLKFEARANAGNLSDPKVRKTVPKLRGYRPKRSHTLGLYVAIGQKEQMLARLVKRISIPAGSSVDVEERFWLPAGHTFGLKWENGPYAKWYNKIKTKGSKSRRARYSAVARLTADMDLPRIRVSDVILKGPLVDTWPPARHRAIYGDGLSNAEIVKRFAARAFRRPVSDAELRPYLKLAGSSRKQLRAALQAILCSPQFTYLYENEGRLDDFAIASRLSYFLWNSMPDEQLIKLAAAGRLRDPKVIHSQVERLLADPRARSFRDEFLRQWLKLDSISEMPPDKGLLPEFLRQNLHPSMAGETTHFFQHLLDKNLPIDNFLDSDFTFVDGTLARFYGIKAGASTGFQKVSLKGVPHRGGLLGQALVLTASANGVDTSPVVRGIWVLDNLLGTPPPPPPPNVTIPDPDTHGAQTIRQVLAKHRTDANCNSCHRKIDPIGFALENYDPIGRWRKTYPNNSKIDAAGEYGGKPFRDVDGLKSILKHHRKTLARGLTHKLLISATGRKMTHADDAEVERIVAALDKEGNGLRDLIHLITTSQAFLNK